MKKQSKTNEELNNKLVFIAAFIRDRDILMEIKGALDCENTYIKQVVLKKYENKAL